MKRIFLIASALLFFTQVPLAAQYFGRNKPRYEKQDFKVTQTPHFEIYEYLDNPAKKKELADAAELWYQMHQAVFQDTFTKRNPLLIYNDHAGFQQTNAIQGDISVGTGGVTEGLRNRIVMPIAPTNQQTNHVLGHEMVHAFQYHLVTHSDSMNIGNLSNLPLWMVEGLAEYLSIGRIDAQTSLWMRDAVLYNRLPKNLNDMDSGRYFPYRWGHSFWAYVAGRYGDEAIRPLFINSAKYGLERGIFYTLNTQPNQLIDDWTGTLRTHYGTWMQRKRPDATPATAAREQDKHAPLFKENTVGKPILTEENAGKMNICPVVSPNGKYVIFLSEKNLFTTDLFLADAKTGELIRKVSSTSQDGHIDQINFLESSGTWSPDSKRFAFDVYQQGRSVLLIKEVAKRGKTLKLTIPGVPSFSNPTWSPDGKTIVVCGLVNGQTDLFAFDVKRRKVRRLTNDKYAEINPSWSADGTRLIYSTDQISMQRSRTNGAWKMNIAILDIASSTSELIDVFPGADNVNPHFDKEGRVLFLSDRDGFRNLYRYDLSTKKAYQMTDLLTGITGVTPYSPAFSVAEDRDRIVYTYYKEGEYVIYQARSEDFNPVEVSADVVNHEAAALPPFNPRERDIVNTNLRLMDNNLPSVSNTTTTEVVPYKPKFKLEFLGGNAGAGIMTGNTSFNNNVGVAGGVNLLFNDILGNNQLFAGAALNGDFRDISGQLSYINRKKRIGWGISASHFPFSSYGGQIGPYEDKIELNSGQIVDAIVIGDVVDRLFNQRVGGVVFYPFSTTRRFEVSAAIDFYQQRSVAYLSYYVPTNFGLQFVNSRTERLPTGFNSSFNIQSVGAAYVGDNSFFGFTAPLKGWRYRLGGEKYFGFWNYTSLLADGRYYKRLRPVTLAVRGLVNARVGGNQDNTNEVFPLYVIQPWNVRGYSNSGIFSQNQGLFQQSAGSKMAIANFEIRLPFTGPRGLALIPTRSFVSDLNVFFDAGIAYFRRSDLETQPPNSTIEQHKPFLSTGVSLRVNLFGALVLEPYFALPLSVPKADRQWAFGLNFIPGW